MNVYFLGMCISMVVYIVIGLAVSRKVKDANDFYVAGRKAPVLLIAGSLIASYTSTGMFMGDAAQCYEGAFTPIILFAGMQSAGYIVGSVFFGRYLRRSDVLTIPEFFGKRFDSKPLRIVSAVTAIVMMTVYLLSVMQGIGTLMTSVTGVDYNLCVILAMIVFTFITIISGSRGVLITDTLMASIFTLSVIVALFMISHKTGGWFSSVRTLATTEAFKDHLSWRGKPGPLYMTGVENLIWGLNYGVVWMSVCMVGPWQSSRYLMAKDEHTIIKSAPVSAVGVFILEFFVGITAVFVNIANPNIENSSQSMIWAAMNMLPLVMGVIMLTGVLAAGISSATTFLSLIGSSVANDIFGAKNKNSINLGRISMLIVSVIVLSVALVNPPSIFWIMFFGGAMAACSWMPVAVGSVFSKRLTKTAATVGMVAGFLSCFVLKLWSALSGTSLPVYLDPSIVGIVFNVLAMIIVSAMTQVTETEKREREKLFIVPEVERQPAEIQKTLRWTKIAAFTGIIVAAMLLVMWAIPYTVAK